jgi:tagatose 6-phosphate kinase
VILAVALNAALDVTYRVPMLERGRTHRVERVITRAGGKGLNVARVLHARGEEVVALAFAGGATGAEIADRLAAEGIATDLVRTDGPSRRTVAVHDEEHTTGFWEPGPAVRTAEWDALEARFRDLAGLAAVVVLAGSLPPGVPADAYRRLTRTAHAAGARVVLDADGAALGHGLAAEPDLVKPNAAELSAATGRPAGTPDEALAAARILRAGRRTAVVASLGPAGIVAHTATGDFRAAPPEASPGNPTGAGDAAVAALAAGLARGLPWPDLLADAVSLSAAAVAAPAAGELDPRTAARVRAAVTVIPFEGENRRAADADR